MPQKACGRAVVIPASAGEEGLWRRIRQASIIGRHRPEADGWFNQKPAARVTRTFLLASKEESWRRTTYE
jgi:hypothetical protein